MDAQLNDRVTALGREIFERVGRETPSLFDQGRWLGTLIDWTMRQEEFRVRLFRFVDLFPSLTTDEALLRHLREYFGEEGEELPAALRWGAQAAKKGGRFGAALLGGLIRRQVRTMARQFIVGETAAEAVRRIGALRREGFAAVVDLLGEATISEAEAEAVTGEHLRLLTALEQAQAGWPALGGGAGPDWGSSPRVQIAVKPTSLFSQVRPQAFEASVAGIMARLGRIAERVVELGGFLCLDMEAYPAKDITLEVYRRLRRRFPDYPHLGLALQSYLKDTDRDLEELLAWARDNQLPISVRLVKGAYWDAETVKARQHGWETPVWEAKAQTDAAFERQAELILRHHDICHFACGSHNIRSIAAVLALARSLGVPAERYEFQVLYGMAEPVRRALLEAAGRVRLYAPFGELVPGMAYLVRRLLENTADTSFLRQSFAEGEPPERLLADPRRSLPEAQAEPAPPPAADGIPPFANEAAADFARPALRRAFPEALAAVRGQLGRTIPLFIDGRDVTTAERAASTNPAAPGEVVASACQAGPEEVAAAVAAARKAFPAWRDAGAERRAELLRQAAAAARRRLVELAAWQVLEVGKQWDQAHADVAEAIDFLEYYAREMLRLGEPRPLGDEPGEENVYLYEPRGVAAVIAPWNFPLAISCGMAAAALAAGNCVVYKPSGLTPAVGRQLVELFTEAGLPPGVFNFLPGPGGTVGEVLVGHPEVDLVAFTGSLEVGLSIIEKAAKVVPGQRQVRRVVAEMGGKNAVIVDDDADLDEAVPGVLASAFGFQGQKCSACSRVIVLEAVYERFVERLVAAARALPVGPAEDPANVIGPLAEEAAKRKVLDYIEIGRSEGEILFSGEFPSGEGWYVPPTIVGGIRPEHRLAREEIFGPVLAVMRARDFEEALEWAMSTPYALTGGVFSRSPARLEEARRRFRVGNLYLNRGITGALVGRQPFGGAGLSGLGTKAGGPDYLRHFMDPRVMTENTMRRGFAPRKD